MAKLELDGVAGAIVVLFLVAVMVDRMGTDSATTNSFTARSVTTSPPATATRRPSSTQPPEAVVTAPAPVLATAAPVLPPFDWTSLRGVAVDHDVTPDGRFILQVANRADDSVRTFEVPKSIFDACAIPSEFDGSRMPPCSR